LPIYDLPSCYNPYSVFCNFTDYAVILNGE